MIGDNKKIIIIRDYDTGKEKSEPINTNKIINMDILPDENEFLDKKEELHEYIFSYIYNSIIKNISLPYIKNVNTISYTENFYTIQISKKINNSDIVNSSSVVFSENNGIDSYKPVIAASIMGACMGSFFNSINILESKKRKNKNYAKAT